MAYAANQQERVAPVYTLASTAHHVRACWGFGGCALAERDHRAGEVARRAVKSVLYVRAINVGN